jgi:hypothetical protein
MKNKLPLSYAIALTLLSAQGAIASGASVPGEKLDSGLGQLPHYSKWADASGRVVASTKVAGESLDDGLGQLPHYAHWVDKSGADPLGVKMARR